MNSKISLSIVIPALNEEKTIGLCVKKALDSMRRLNIEGEVVVADNGSTDGTVKTAEALGARTVHVKHRGYGNALMGGFQAAQGKYLIMADADDSYDLSEIEPFWKKLQEGHEFVMGNRFQGYIEKGAMPFLHRYLGTPVLTGLMNLFFKTGIGDANCGMRGLTKTAFTTMHLRAEGMECATEMVIKASRRGLKIAEVPCDLFKDKRDRKPHLRTWQDGWRHLRFMLLFTATWTFLVPGAILSGAGLVGMILLFLRDIFWPDAVSAITQKHIHSFMLIFLTGCQIFGLGLIAKVFSFSKRFDHASRSLRLLSRHFTLERGIMTGLGLVVISVGITSYIFISFYTSLLPRLTDLIRLDIAIFGIAFFLLGIQSIFTSFVLSLFYLKVK